MPIISATAAAASIVALHETFHLANRKTDPGNFWSLTNRQDWLTGQKLQELVESRAEEGKLVELSPLFSAVETAYKQLCRQRSQTISPMGASKQEQLYYIAQSFTLNRVDDTLPAWVYALPARYGTELSSVVLQRYHNGSGRDRAKTVEAISAYIARKAKEDDTVSPEDTRLREALEEAKDHLAQVGKDYEAAHMREVYLTEVYKKAERELEKAQDTYRDMLPVVNQAALQFKELAAKVGALPVKGPTKAHEMAMQAFYGIVNQARPIAAAGKV